MGRTGRRWWLIVHIISSVSWLGISIAMLTLAITAKLGDADIKGYAYWTMHLLVSRLVIPAALISLLSGVVVGLTTPWGLVKHTWVLVKLVLTLVTTVLTTFLLRPAINQAYEHSVPRVALSADDLERVGISLISAGIVSTSIYTFAAILSVLKPWGRTPWGRTARRAQPTTR